MHPYVKTITLLKKCPCDLCKKDIEHYKERYLKETGKPYDSIEEKIVNIDESSKIGLPEAAK